MMSRSSQLFLLTVFLSPSLARERLSVYGPVPGLSPSPYYSVQVREERQEVWLHPFTLLTECTAEKFCNTTGMFGQLNNWSNSYVNFQLEEEVRVEVRIRKLWGDPVTKAVVRPVTAAVSCEVVEGEVLVVIDKPVLFTVDINGQMDDQHTGWDPDRNTQYDGPPIHTVTIFANPFLAPPDLEDPGVVEVSPGEEVPSEGPWHTLYFLPGIHDVGLDFLIHSNRSYYIPGDAVVYGTLSKDEYDTEMTENIHIYGHGTLSGDRIPHYDYSPRPEEDHYKFYPVRIKNSYNVTVEGVTVANSAYHSISMGTSNKPEHPDNTIRWVKIFTWRANGDGVGTSGNLVVEDSFVRTQDDSSYVGGRGMRRVVFWQDSNGASFVMHHIGSNFYISPDLPLVIEDCTVVYARSKFHHNVAGGVFSLRGRGHGSGGNTITFRNIAVEDPRPTHMHFKVMMTALPPWGHPEDRTRGPGDVYGITFQNINIAAHGVVENEPELLWGMEDGLIYGFIFDNVTIGSDRVESIDFFHHNEYVFDDMEIKDRSDKGGPFH